jgi:hypothetical protein
MTYKGRILDPKANELADGSGWRAEVFIAEQDGADIVDTAYSLNGSFPTRATALDAAVASATREVDRRIAG